MALWVGRAPLSGLSASVVSAGLLPFLLAQPAGAWAGLEVSGRPLSHT